MKKVSMHFVKGRIYSDLSETNTYPKVYFKLIEIDPQKGVIYLEQVGGPQRYIPYDNGYYYFNYPTIMYELSEEEVQKLQEEGIIKL